MDKPAPRHGLIATILILMAVAVLAPRFSTPPKLQEGRVLAGPPVWTAGEGLRGVRHQTDAWVADRFPARPYLIGGLNYARLQVGDSGSARVLAGRDGWLFYNDGQLLAPARGQTPLDAAQTAEWLRGLSARVEALRAKGVVYLVVVPPAKETVYPQFGPGWYPGPSPRRLGATLTALADRAEPGHVVYLHDAVQQVANAGVDAFSRHDTHWTGDGAYAGYVATMARLRALGVNQPMRPISDFTPRVNDPNPPRDLALMLGVASFEPVRYRSYLDPRAHPPKVTWLSDGRGWTAPQVVDTGEADKPTLMMIRDSFSNALTPFLMGHFSRVILTHIDDGFWRQDLIDRFHPDVVLLEVQEHGLRFAMQGSPAASPDTAVRVDHILAAAGSAPSPSSSAPETPRGLVAMSQAGGAFAGLDTVVATPGCNVDQARMDAGGLAVTGWISDLSARAGPTNGAVRLTGPAGDFVQRLTIDQDRPDVAAAYRRAVAQPSGFSARLKVQNLPPGAYDLRVYRRSATGWIGCAGPAGLLRR